jgi:hypothetical protein
VFSAIFITGEAVAEYSDLVTHVSEARSNFVRRMCLSGTKKWIGDVVKVTEHNVERLNLFHHHAL